MKEGSLEAPTRHVIAWQDPDFTDMAKIEAEMHRVFDICHGCRRCFNLCESFPRLFELADNSPTGELDAVTPDQYKPVVDACTLCDMCFMTKCPYVPPHESISISRTRCCVTGRSSMTRGADRGRAANWPRPTATGSSPILPRHWPIGRATAITRRRGRC